MKPPPNLYRKDALAFGRDADTVSRALAIAATVEDHGGEPVFTLAHLALRCGVSSRYLRLIVDRQGHDPYLPISRAKRGGESRALFSPEPLLMDAQRWILKNVLPACKTHASSYAYETGRSAVTCAQQHIGAKWLVKLDVHDFFHSVPEWRIYRLLRDAGYADLLAFQVARICTRSLSPRTQPIWGLPHPRAMAGVLPQGAPTSGRLANAAVYYLDVQLQAIASESGLTYTRYSDDIVFSGRDGITRREAVETVARASGSLRAFKLVPHEKKTRIIPPGGRKIVLGLLVEDDRVLLTARFKRRLSTHIRGVSKFGLPEHAEFRGFRSVLSMVNHVDGLIAYARSVEPDFAGDAASRWDEALEAGAYPVSVRPDRPL